MSQYRMGCSLLRVGGPKPGDETNKFTDRCTQGTMHTEMRDRVLSWISMRYKFPALSEALPVCRLSFNGILHVSFSWFIVSFCVTTDNCRNFPSQFHIVYQTAPKDRVWNFLYQLQTGCYWRSVTSGANTDMSNLENDNMGIFWADQLLSVYDK